MFMERKGKKREWERNCKECFSFLSCSSIFLTTFFLFLAKIVKTGQKRAGTTKKGWKDVELRRTAVPRRSKLLNLARFRFICCLKPVFGPVPALFLPLSKAVLDPVPNPFLPPFNTRSCPFIVLLNYHI